MPSCSLTLVYHSPHKLTSPGSDWNVIAQRCTRTRFSRAVPLPAPASCFTKSRPAMLQCCCLTDVLIKPLWNKLIKVNTWIASSAVAVKRSNVGQFDRVLFPVQSLQGLPTQLLSARQLPLWLTLPCQWPHPRCSTLSALTPLSLPLFLWLVHNQGCARPQDGPRVGQVLPG